MLGYPESLALERDVATAVVNGGSAVHVLYQRLSPYRLSFLSGEVILFTPVLQYSRRFSIKTKVVSPAYTSKEFRCHRYAGKYITLLDRRE
jgi:hypothetical protein